MNMTFFQKFFLFFSLAIVCAGCGTDETMESQSSLDINPLSAKPSLFDQSPSNMAKESLMEYEEITGIKAVNSDKEMIIAVQIKHMKRFFMAKHRKAWQKEMEKQFPGWKVELSTDRKIYLELDKLEEKINNDTLSKDELKKEMKHIIKLSKEQT